MSTSSPGASPGLRRGRRRSTTARGRRIPTSCSTRSSSTAGSRRAARRSRSARAPARRRAASRAAGVDRARARAEPGDGPCAARATGVDVEETSFEAWTTARRGVPARVRRAGVALGARRRPLREGRGRARAGRHARAVLEQGSADGRARSAPTTTPRTDEHAPALTSSIGRVGSSIGRSTRSTACAALPRRGASAPFTWTQTLHDAPSGWRCSARTPTTGCCPTSSATRLHAAVGDVIDEHGGQRRRRPTTSMLLPRDARTSLDVSQ